MTSEFQKREPEEETQPKFGHLNPVTPVKATEKSSTYHRRLQFSKNCSDVLLSSEVSPMTHSEQEEDKCDS